MRPILTLIILALACSFAAPALAGHSGARGRGLFGRRPVRTVLQARPVRGRLGSCGRAGCN